MLAHFAHHLLTALPTPLLPFIRSEFSLDYTKSALVVSAFGLSYGISQLPAGWVADRIGPRIPITVGLCGVALVGIFIGLSHTYVMLLVFLVLMGVVGGGYHPASAPLISTLVETKKRGRALGIHTIGGGGSFFLAPIVAAAIATAWGWRGSFLALAVPTAVFGFIFYIFLGRLAGMGRVQPVKPGPGDKAPSPSGGLRRLVAFMILSVFTGGLVTSMIAFIPLYMVDHFGASEATAASMLAIVYSGGLWVGPLGGYLSDRLGSIPVILATCFIAGPVIYLLNLASYGLGIGALLLVIGMMSYIRMPVSEVYIIGHTAPRHRSTVYGIYYFSMQEVGAALAPVMGSLIDHFGYYDGFTIAGAASVFVTLVCSVFLLGSRD